jgi:hypothetical protein
LNFFFEEPSTRVCWACINREEAITKHDKKKKNNNNLTKEATTKPLPQETQSPQTTKGVANKRYSSRQRAQAMQTSTRSRFLAAMPPRRGTTSFDVVKAEWRTKVFQSNS